MARNLRDNLVKSEPYRFALFSAVKCTNRFLLEASVAFWHLRSILYDAV